MTPLVAFEPPGPPRFKTNSFDECRDYIQTATGTHRFDAPKAAGSVDFAHYVSSIGRVTFNLVELNCAEGFTIMKSAAAPHYSFQFLLEGDCRLEGLFGSGVARPGDVFVLDPEQVTREFWPHGCRQFLLHVGREIVEDMVSAELGRRLPGPIVFDPIGRDPGIALWLNHFANILSGQDPGASLLSDRRVMTSVERTLLTMLLAGLPHSASPELAIGANGASPYYVRRAEAYIRANILEELTTDGIAAAAKVSVRSIFYGFKRWRGTTPMAYVRDFRLEIARAELEKARVRGGTVSEAAMSAGFTNFSQFSKIYKTRFGQTPSATLMAN